MIATRSILSTFGWVALTIGGLFIVDTFLARIDREESHVEAQRLFDQGQSMMATGDNLKAIDKFNDAIGIERDNHAYLIALAEAQYADNKFSEADTTLMKLLVRDSTDGLANLILARVLLKEGRISEGISYFHRAIYGHWERDAAENRRKARLELIDLLAQQNAKEELLAELLPLEDQTPRDMNTRTRLGDLFLRAGAPTRAVDVFRRILHDDPQNAAARSGLGQAEFAEGDYRAAQRDFQMAERIAPDDHANRHWLDLCTQLLQLDPTLRGLRSGERWRRSTELVKLAQEAVSQCATQPASPELAALLSKADDAQKARVTSMRQSEAADGNLDLAEQLWQARKKECQLPPPTESPLALVLARLAR